VIYITAFFHITLFLPDILIVILGWGNDLLNDLEYPRKVAPQKGQMESPYILDRLVS